MKSVKEECLSKLILFGESSLRHTLRECLVYYNGELNHQGKGNILLFLSATTRVNSGDSPVRCRERLGGLLRYYYQEAA